MNTPNDIEQLENYLHDRMAPSERLALEAAMEANPELYKQLEALRAEPEVLKLLRQHLFRKQLKAWKDRQERRRKWFLRISYFILTATALSALAIFTGRWPADTAKLPEQQEQSTPPPLPPYQHPPISSPPVAPSPQAQNLKTLPSASFFVQLADSLISLNKPGRSSLAGAPVLDSLYNLAMAKYETDAPAALALLEQSLLIDVTKPDLLRLKAYILYSLGQNTAAAQTYAKLKNLSNNLNMVDAEKAEIACYLRLLPGTKAPVDSLLTRIITAGPDVSERRKNFARKLRDQISAGH
jgi:hypothetical protein